jgi:nitrogen fixation NifU-like protein
MLRLFGAKLTPNRQKCCLLSWRVLQQAIYAPIGEAASNGDANEPLRPTPIDEAKKG